MAWEKLSTTVLTGTADEIDSGTIDARINLFATLFIKDSGTANLKLQFNDVTTTTYATRYNENNSSDTTQDTQASIRLYQTGSGTNIERYVTMFISNIGSKEKLVTAQVNEMTATGAGTAPLSVSVSGKWESGTNSITSIQAINDAAGSFAADSALVVYGSVE
jgi:hypothetical protein